MLARTTLQQALRLRVSATAKIAATRTYHAGAVKINGQRLNETLHQTCEWGKAHPYGQNDERQTGMARLTLDENDVKAREWFANEMKALGCKLTIDSMGNMFAVRPGKQDQGPPIAMGSHLDTQPTGGRYDGVLGIMAAIEAMRTLHERNIITNNPVAVVNWTNEEGARFPRSICGSGVWAEWFTQEDAYALQDKLGNDATMGNALQKSGYKGDVAASYKETPLKAHFELHIEQGPILEKEDALIGVVEGGQAYQWIEITVNGIECHTGTTPFDARADALLAASQIIVASNALAKEHGGLASTGILSLQPGSVNTCPGQVRFMLDVRHKTNAGKQAIADAVRAKAEDILRQNAKYAPLDWRVTFDSPAIEFDKQCIEAVQVAAGELVQRRQIKRLISGAGHDSCATSSRCPTAMIFVPSKDGLSHHPKEYTSPEHCTLGAQVLLDAVLRYDQAV